MNAISVGILEIRCPICSAPIDERADFVAMEVNGVTVIPEVQGDQLIAALNLFAAHIVKAHTSGLDESAVNNLAILFGELGDDTGHLFNQMKELFGVSPQ